MELNICFNDFCSCSDDGTLKLFSLNQNKDIKDKIINEDFIFNFNEPIINMIETNKDEIVTIFSYNNHFLKFLNIKNKSSKKTIVNISIIGNNSICLFNKKYLIMGGSYMITVIDIFDYSKQIIDTNSWKIYTIINYEDKYIFYSDDDSNIYFCELIIDNFLDIKLKKIFCHKLFSSSILSMIFAKKNKKIIAGGINSTINILNLFTYYFE
jgi:WD40 repeat protein